MTFDHLLVYHLLRCKALRVDSSIDLLGRVNFMGFVGFDFLFFLAAFIVVCGSVDLISASSSLTLESTSGSDTSDAIFEGFFVTVSFDATFSDEWEFPSVVAYFLRIRIVSPLICRWGSC